MIITFIRSARLRKMTKETKFILVTSHKVFIKSRWNINISLSQLVVYPANEHASAKKATHTYFHLSLNSRQTFFINFQLEADKSFQCLNFSWNPWQLRLWLFRFLQNHLSFTHCPLSNHLANFEFFRLSFLVHHAQRKSYKWYSYRKNPPDFEIMPLPHCWLKMTQYCKELPKIPAK